MTLTAETIPARREAMIECINAMTGGDHRALSMRFEQGMRGPEIAAALGWQLCEVQTSLHRSMRKLVPELNESQHAALLRDACTRHGKPV